jgi:hypothetical protein
MAITAGTIILKSGKAIESLKAALTTGLGIGAIAAGGLLIGVGIAAKAGLKALASGGGGGGGASSTSFSGGSGGFSPKTEMKPVEIYGKISGADILLSSERAAELRKR